MHEIQQIIIDTRQYCKRRVWHCGTEPYLTTWWELGNSLRAKISHLEKKLTEVTREKEKELATTWENLRVTRTEVDIEANSGAAKKEAELLYCKNKMKYLEQERYALWICMESAQVSHSAMLCSLDKFVQAQTKMMQAQANAVAVLSFPPLLMLTDEDVDSDEKWLIWLLAREVWRKGNPCWLAQ